ncbi:E3 ubiquitin-protein ligase ATL4-like [Panicum miliaceum]|uniref:E3 ubiquitin-protein ligase ATL4-like n=1 Tax=Panicum miliaceum TaxID=4540 RepID=A0A3L6R8I5_PANMI|nr:E3 ubiquitin-protein ligase ATL4-like [Panicum miliaceum]
MAPPPGPLAADDDTPPPPSLKSALLIIGGLLLFAIAAIVLLRYLLRRWASSSSRPGRMAEVEQGGAARRTGAAGREQVEAEAGAARRIAAVVRRGERLEVENSPDCAVCLAAFEPDAGLRLLPACRHAFHAACIDAWLRTNPVCPICRGAVSFPLPPLPAAAAGQEPLGSRASSRRSFRVELGSVSNRRSSCAAGGDDHRRTYSLGGSFDYRVDEEVEAIVSRIVRPAAAARQSTAAPAAPAAPGEALAEAVGSRGWLGEYLDRDPAAAKSATPAAVTAPGEEALAEAAGSRGRPGPGELRDRDNLAPSASSLSGRWSRRWSQGHRRDESWRWDPEAACRAPREEEREPADLRLLARSLKHALRVRLRKPNG